ncbi:Intracellular sulfur oxidation protein [gamma proteobacterium HdN1]|nr:Intracellular sulfur oxidation protein [gamma proteobacterium HdN1]
MIFALNVLAPPYARQGALTALRFAQAAIHSGHQVNRIFFSGDGVLNGSALGIPPQDEINLYARWQLLAVNHQVELVLCISACLKRGMVNESEQSRYGLKHNNIAEHFIVAGLGQLAESTIVADRILTFG